MCNIYGMVKTSINLVASVGTLQTGMFSKEFNRNKCMQIKIKQKAMSSTA
jgi:hypothetical protein